MSTKATHHRLRSGEDLSSLTSKLAVRRYTTDDSTEMTSGNNSNSNSNNNNNAMVDWSSYDVPKQYVYDPYHAEPPLPNLRALQSFHDRRERESDESAGRRRRASFAPRDSSSDGVDGGVRLEEDDLTRLLEAAERDYRLHLARQRAVAANDPRLLTTATATDGERLVESDDEEEDGDAARLARTRADAPRVLAALDAPPSRPGMARPEIARERAARWREAGECHALLGDEEGGPSLLRLLDRLCADCHEEEELLEALSAASSACAALVAESTSPAVATRAETARAREDRHRFRLEAHRAFAERARRAADALEEAFRAHGRDAVRIGGQLEKAEAVRRRCEAASDLLRRWWNMEELATREAEDGVEIRVVEEVRGVVPRASCKMDPLYTRKGNDAEAARTLRRLRAVVRSRGSVVVDGGGGRRSRRRSSDVPAAAAAKRFEITRNLINRTSEALEQRLVNDFSDVYGRGGAYDFTSRSKKPRPGTLDWRKLRTLAEALMCFDNGRRLFKRYVDLVVTTKFPELFQKDFMIRQDGDKDANDRDHDVDYSDEEDDYDDDQDNANLAANTALDPDNEMDDEDHRPAELDISATHSRLSQLFHRVSQVCTAEFELISHVFSSAPRRDADDDGNDPDGGADDPDNEDARRGRRRRPPRLAEDDRVDAVARGPDPVPLRVARSLLQRVISDSRNGLQARINELLSAIDRRSDFDASAKKLDTFVVIHEKAAGLFALLRDAAEKSLLPTKTTRKGDDEEVVDEHKEAAAEANALAVSSLVQFLTSQEIALSDGHRRGYLNLELRMLHHKCCAGFDKVGAKMVMSVNKSRRSRRRVEPSETNADPSDASTIEYVAPPRPLDKAALVKSGIANMLDTVLKGHVLRQPLTDATDSLARARLMFGTDNPRTADSDDTARVVTAIYEQMCDFYGGSYLGPVVEALGESLTTRYPDYLPDLPFDENKPAHDLGVPSAFWVCMERVHSAARAFDRELWAENRPGSARAWEILRGAGGADALAAARARRRRSLRDLERAGEAAVSRALDALSMHAHWLLVTGGESAADASAGGARSLFSAAAATFGGGPYAVPTPSELEAANSPAVRSLTFCLREQFVNVQSALTPESLSAFWTALSMRIYNLLCKRLLQHYGVSVVGAAILSRDVEALRMVAMLAGTNHSHWDTLKELLTLYMTPPEALKTILVGPAGAKDSGLFHHAGRDRSLIFMSRRTDFRVKVNSGWKKSAWASALFQDLGVTKDPTVGTLNVDLYAAQRKPKK